jgi:hypothetical protein
MRLPSLKISELAQRLPHDDTPARGIGVGEREALFLVGQFGISEFDDLPRQPQAGLERVLFPRPEDLISP